MPKQYPSPTIATPPRMVWYVGTDNFRQASCGVMHSMNDQPYDRALDVFASASEAEDSGDLLKAIHLYKVAGRMDFSPAYINLGNLFDDTMQPNDSRRAIYYYKKVLAMGDAVGAYCLAIHYQNLNNRRWHRFWLRKAAEMGYDDAVDDMKAFGHT